MRVEKDKSKPRGIGYYVIHNGEIIEYYDKRSDAIGYCGGIGIVINGGEF